MKVIKIIGMFILVIGVFNSCQGPYTEKENGKAVELSEYSSFQIVLKGDPGSDMVWQTVYYEKDLIKPGSIEVTDEKDDKGQIVKSFLFSFDTDGSGESVVKLVYGDSTDAQSLPAKTYEIKIICGMMAGIESN